MNRLPVVASKATYVGARIAGNGPGTNPSCPAVPPSVATTPPAVTLRMV